MLDGAVVILCAVGGVEAQTETVWQQCRKYHVPAMAFVNKLDRLGADFYSVIEQIRTRLEVTPLPIQIPSYDGDTFKGIIDLISWKRLVWDDDSLGATYEEIAHSRGDAQEAATSAREKMLETLADFDDEIMESFLAGELPDEKEDQTFHQKGDHRRETHPCPVRIGTEEQRDPALDRGGDRLPPFAAGGTAGDRPSTRSPAKRSPSLLTPRGPL